MVGGAEVVAGLAAGVKVAGDVEAADKLSQRIVYSTNLKIPIKTAGLRQQSRPRLGAAMGALAHPWAFYRLPL
jgi:hypothetical protein